MNGMRIDTREELIKPRTLIDALPISSEVVHTITTARHHANQIIHGKDKRLLVIIGPCSIHDTEAALEYATRLKSAATQFADDLFIIMRAYFEKPRTTMGWKGLISDPYLDGRFDVNHGLTLARQLLLNLNQLGMPAGTEFLDTLILPQYLSDLVSWCAVGARTVESQTHRELASGLPMPVGFKNNTDGNIKVAIDAINVAKHPHHFISMTKEGVPSILHTTGNHSCHLILRGAHHATNYQFAFIQESIRLLKDANLNSHIMIDCSHGNSLKNHLRQAIVVDDIAAQISNGAHSISGVMIESNLEEGKQELHLKDHLIYGKSITDGCLGWEDSFKLLETLALAVKNRRVS